MLDYTNTIYYTIKNSIPEQYRPYARIKARANGWYEVCYAMVTAFYRMSNDGKILEVQVD